ncbi:MAG: NADH-ubiquinone oxidoreductase subunit E family protein [Campylobacter sp.]|uniref:NADH-ubiquinone oxidoreductase subunit E family protein n=1 Tax=unclassified Campylobacter TaxID=2593542 RepID=UPI001B78B298|nr:MULTISPECIES: NADH-ubiquinone oxidoreductase subunit E family protein [unclassified Campylobacter]MBP3207517.1 NADH-ubiquinone oxidoreductase subunit E family protein [Campylobacter sp.]MBP5778726.1 NADH-ubiquinone oxidoreductase subunit E family protein [Campylobacter sp.]MBQ2431445.1 NADH-ubiquinone oxidoreductase subunit E family protein [Campylobacter sp.]MBQ7270552.1 NADH-ubiquinone oxidoreductase subunit E family protein [Campylobacter sp.]MBQ7675557.1 NADH-ubiquinone oxidoreductase s
MKRYDLRRLKGDFLNRMGEIIKNSNQGDVMIFLFEIGDFSGVQKSANLVDGLNSTLLNSLRYNQVDWSIVVKKGRI